MSETQDVVAFIPARAGSKGIPGKNAKMIAGKPLITWAVEAAVHCQDITRVVVSTDGDDIEAAVRSLDSRKVEIFRRSDQFAGDAASTESAMLEYFAHRPYEIVVLIQATSPLIRTADLSAGLSLLYSAEARSVVSVVRQHRFIWKEDGEGHGVPCNYDPLHRPRRQHNKGYLVENGAFYVTYWQDLVQHRCRLSSPVALFEMSSVTYHEIDNEEDWIVVESLLHSRSMHEHHLHTRH